MANHYPSTDEIQAHQTDADWLLERKLVIRRPSSDWQPIEDCVPNMGKCWVTIELADGQKYVDKSIIRPTDIERGVKRIYPCIVAWMPCEISPEPYAQPQTKTRISLFVAECQEFPDLGECHRDVPDLETAFRLYDAIPPERMHGGRCIGFNLMNGDEVDAEYPLVSGGHIEDWVRDDRHLKEMPEVQELIRKCESILEARKTNTK